MGKIELTSDEENVLEKISSEMMDVCPKLYDFRYDLYKLVYICCSLKLKGRIEIVEMTKIDDNNICLKVRRL